MKDTRRARLAVALLLATALILITVDHRAGGQGVLNPVRGAASTVFGQVERVTAGITRPVVGFVDMLRGAPEAQRVIADLRTENAKLREQLGAQRLNRQRAEQLDRMFGLAGLGRYRVVPAMVIARRAVPGFEEAVEIDAGTADGVRPDMTVLSPDGLVGRVVWAGPTNATVALLTDPTVSVGARLEGGNQLGLVNGLGEAGGGDNLIRFRLLDSTVPLGVGRRIVSFGSLHGKPYVPGVPIGVIQRVESPPDEVTKIAYARPFADFASIDVVGVVVAAPKRDPRDAVLPPVPQPAKPAERQRAQQRDRRMAEPPGQRFAPDRGRVVDEQSDRAGRAVAEESDRSGRFVVEEPGRGGRMVDGGLARADTADVTGRPDR